MITKYYKRGIMITILQIKILKTREAKKVAQGQAVGKWWSSDTNPGLCNSSPIPSLPQNGVQHHSSPSP